MPTNFGSRCCTAGGMRRHSPCRAGLRASNIHDVMLHGVAYVPSSLSGYSRSGLVGAASAASGCPALAPSRARRTNLHADARVARTCQRGGLGGWQRISRSRASASGSGTTSFTTTVLMPAWSSGFHRPAMAKPSAPTLGLRFRCSSVLISRPLVPRLVQQRKSIFGDVATRLCNRCLWLCRRL